MEQYLQYQQLLSNNIAQQEEEAQGLREKFETLLSRTQGEKAGIERATDAIGGLFMIKPSEALAKVSGRLVKAGVEKGKDFIGKGIQDLAERATQLKEPITEKLTEVLRSIAPKSEPTQTEMTTIREPQETMRVQDLIMEQDPETTDPTEGMQTQQTRTTDPTEPQEGEGMQTVQEAEQSAQEATVNVSGEAESAVKGTTDAVADANLDAGLETGGELLADLDPLTAIAGLIFGVVSLVGGMEGANSIKNPPVPKIPAMAQSSVQFGF